MITQNFTVIILELFLDIMKNQHIQQGVKWKVSYFRDQQPISGLTGHLFPGEVSTALPVAASLMREAAGALCMGD